MTTLVRWNPSTLFNEFDRLMENAPRNRTLTVALDVAENEDGYVVVATIPGVNAEDIEIVLEDGVLSIKGEIPSNNLINDEQYHIRERRFGKFSRSIRFPADVDADNIEATYENGVLTLAIPKVEEVKPRRIAVKIN